MAIRYKSASTTDPYSATGQNLSAGENTINHNLNTTSIVAVSVYDSAGNIQGSDYQIIDADNIKLYLIEDLNNASIVIL